MRRHVYMILFLFYVLVLTADAAEPVASKDPQQAFYAGNALYEKRDYIKALLEYDTALSSGSESGNIYYNIGNGFFKLGKFGYAILYYEKARQFMPDDSDLKSNIAYARSTINDAGYVPQGKEAILAFIVKPFEEFNLTEMAVMTFIYYICVLCIAAVLILVRRTRKLYLLYIPIFIGFVYFFLVFFIRYDAEIIQSRGVILQKDADVKYEPIDKSTTFYKLREGNVVKILTARNGWCRICRDDGKVGWIKKEAIENIKVDLLTKKEHHGQSFY